MGKKGFLLLNCLGLIFGLFVVSCQSGHKVRGGDDEDAESALIDDPIVFTSEDHNAVAYMPGTVTFPEGSNIPYLMKDFDILEEIDENTLEAAVVFRADFDFSTDRLSGHGQIWNLTDDSQEILMKFYDGDNLLDEASVEMNPHTFYHFIPDEVASNVRSADKVVVTGLDYSKLLQPIPAPSDK